MKPTPPRLPAFLLVLLSLSPALLAPAPPAHAQVATADDVAFYTAEWQGERHPDGRPKVADDVLQRMRNVSIEEAWAVLRRHGYHNQFEGGWQMIHDDVPIVGRALTAAYLHLAGGRGRSREFGVLDRAVSHISGCQHWNLLGAKHIMFRSDRVSSRKH